MYGTFSSVFCAIVRCPEFSRKTSWALVGRALVGPPGPLWAGPCGPPWATVGQALMGLPWALVRRALVGRALVGPPVPLWARPLWAPLCPDGPGPNGPVLQESYPGGLD